MSKLKTDDVRQIRQLYAKGNVTQGELGKQFGVTREAIGRITRGDNWLHIAKEDAQVSLANSSRRACKGEQNHFAKLNENQVREIRTWHAAGDITQAELASVFHVNHQTIYNIIHRKHWRHI